MLITSVCDAEHELLGASSPPGPVVIVDNILNGLDTEEAFAPFYKVKHKKGLSIVVIDYSRMRIALAL